LVASPCEFVNTSAIDCILRTDVCHARTSQAFGVQAAWTDHLGKILFLPIFHPVEWNGISHSSGIRSEERSSLSLLTALPTSSGGERRILYKPKSTPDRLLDSGSMDALITSAEGGLGPLPVGFMCRELGIPKGEIIRWANQISSRPEVTMVALASRKPGGKLRGAILVPFGTTQCCKPPVAPQNRGLPWRDFYYNITFESVSYAVRCWQASKLVTNHLSGCGQEFHPKIPGCQCEALAHFSQDSAHGRVESFEFLGCGCGVIKQDCFNDLYKAIVPNGKHRRIEVPKEPLKDNRGDVIRLRWRLDPQTSDILAQK
jgi:hypothetical protein